MASTLAAAFSVRGMLMVGRRRVFSGLALRDLPPASYSLDVVVHSVAPEGSAGHGFECNNADPGESLGFQVTADGEVIILP